MADQREDILADIGRMIKLMELDKFGPYVRYMSLDILRRVNPALAAEIEAVGPDVPFEILLDDNGVPCGWRRLDQPERTT